MAPRKKPKPVLGHTYLQSWRNYRQISQEEAASFIDIERGTLSKIETAKSPYQQQYVEGLAKLYRCRPADLIATDPNSAPLSPEAQLRLALLSFGVDSADMNRAVGMIRGFLGDPAEPPPQSPRHDQSVSANRRREEEPSR